MTVRPSSRFPFRLERIRHEMRSANLDAFVVTHLPNVRYLTGLSSSAGLILVTQSTATLLIDFRYVTAARSLLDTSPALARVFRVAVPAGSYDELLVSLLTDSGARRIGIEAAWMPVSRFNWLSSRLAGAAPTPLRSETPSPVLVPTERVLETGRLVKDAEEIGVLREAAARLGAMVPAVLALAIAGRTELEVAAGIDALLRESGFERPAFETIVASGPNSARPHARPTRRVVEDGDWVVLDFGGIYDGYCVDLTRTLFLGPSAREARRLFDAVREAHQAAVDAVRPGALPFDIDGAARRVLERHGLGEAFGHGTGHGLGLEVHEEPRISRHATGSEGVVAGMVFTIEPGAYVPGTGGVRIEDDVLVVDGGCEVLTDVPIDFGEA